MLSHFFEGSARIHEIRSSPCGALLEDFSDYLFQNGYAEISARRHIRSAEHLTHWASRKGLGVNQLVDPALKRFADHLTRCRCGRYSRTKRRDILTGARLFLRYAQGADTRLIRMPGPADPTPALLESFCQWMRRAPGKLGTDPL